MKMIISLVILCIFLTIGCNGGIGNKTEADSIAPDEFGSGAGAGISEEEEINEGGQLEILNSKERRAEKQFSSYYEWENWASDSVLKLTEEFSGCIGSCDDNPGCRDYACVNSCSESWSRGLDSLKHDSYNSLLEIKPIILEELRKKFSDYMKFSSSTENGFIAALGNELINTMTDIDGDGAPGKFVSCISNCLMDDCFSSICVNECEKPLKSR